MNDHTALLNRIRQVSALAPFNQWLDLRVEHAEAGQVILRLDWRNDFAQYNGHLHAALIGGLIDTACGFAAGTVAFDTETTSLDAERADLVGFSLSVRPGEACYVPLAHRAPDLLAGADRIEQIPLAEALAMLKPLLEDPAVLKIGQNIKYDMRVMARHGVTIAPIDDSMLLSFVLDGGLHGHGMDELSTLHLDYKPIPFKEVAGTGKNQITFDQVPLAKACDYAAEDADITLRLYQVLKPRLVREHMVTFYERLERPLAPVLARVPVRALVRTLVQALVRALVAASVAAAVAYAVVTMMVMTRVMMLATVLVSVLAYVVAMVVALELGGCWRRDWYCRRQW